MFKHVIYIIKENRTYDQVLGDMKEGNGDPKLCMFGEEVTPNHHALARQFTLFDNFYCSGVLSADGHYWCNEAYVSDYLEKAFGGFTRSYPDDGSDPLAYASDRLPVGQRPAAQEDASATSASTSRTTSSRRRRNWTDLYADYKNGTQQGEGRRRRPNVKTLEPYTHPGYPWFPLLMPDVYRARLFLDELKECEKKGEMPNLDLSDAAVRPHRPAPRPATRRRGPWSPTTTWRWARSSRRVSKSKFWADTCIFVVEDDPQNGFDHVDGHRTVALVISPYTKRKFVDHTNYNQTGMVKTIELILGLPPMNQLDLSATPMRNCFQAEPDLTPYTCVPNKIPLDEMNKPLEQAEGRGAAAGRRSRRSWTSTTATRRTRTR